MGSTSKLRGVYKASINELEKKYEALLAQSSERVLVTSQALHDVRGTLTLLKFCAESAAKCDELARMRTFVHQVLKSAEDLNELVGELVSYHQGDARTLPLQPRETLLDEELAHLLSSFRSQAESKGLSFQVRSCEGLPPRVRLAPIGLRRILGNVLSNAVKFTDRGSIEVTLTHSAGILDVLVADDGIGIPHEHHDALFHPYKRIADDKERSGLGLGLFTGRQIAVSMGGDLRLVHSEPGRGSLFRITIRAEVIPA